MDKKYFLVKESLKASNHFFFLKMRFFSRPSHTIINFSYLQERGGFFKIESNYTNIWCLNKNVFSYLKKKGSFFLKKNTNFDCTLLIQEVFFLKQGFFSKTVMFYGNFKYGSSGLIGLYMKQGYISWNKGCWYG